MLKFKTVRSTFAYLSSNLLNEVGWSLFRYFEVGLRVCDIVVKKFTFVISSPDEFLLQHCHSVEALPNVPETKLNAGAYMYLPIFPYRRYQAPFPNSTAFMLFESVTDKQKKQTKNIELFRPLAARKIRAPPNLAW